MKKIIFVFAAVIIIMQACQKRSIPTITTRTTEPPSPVTSTNAPVDVVSGKVIFTARCSRCHVLPDPLKYTSQRWGGILSTMIPRARLTKEEGDNVTAYIRANVKQ